MMHDERADRQLTRADFGDNESWAKYLRASCLTPTDEAGRAVWTYIGGDGPEATLHRAIHGATKRLHQLAFEGYGATSYVRNRDFVKVYDALRLANCRGLVLNAFVSVSWSTVGVTRDGAVAKANERLLELMRKCHVAVCVPYDYKEPFARSALRAVQTISGRPPVRDRRRKIWTVKVIHRPDRRLRVQWKLFRYLMKGMSPGVLVKNPTNRFAPRPLKTVAGLKLESQGEISTKRAG
jgi:hypothetical protein